MKIKIISVGKLKEKYLKEGIAEYLKRMQTMTPIEMVEVDDEKIPQNASPKECANIKNREGERILARVSGDDTVVVLAIQGKLWTSEELAEFVGRCETYGARNLIFIIGGSLGLSDEVLARADVQISFGRFTLPHQLMRLVLCEQVYRAQMINAGRTYHK